MDESGRNLLSLQIQKEISSLFKSFLEILEDLQFDNAAMIEKLSKVCDEETVKHINYFTPDKYEQIRKRILDNGNSCSRKMLSFLEYYDCSINNEKLQAALNQRRITRKFSTSTPLIIE
jgi:hypothetical protein